MEEKDAFSYPQPVSAKTQHLVRWMMTPKRGARPQSVAEVRDFLRKPFSEPRRADSEEVTVYASQKPKPAPERKPSGSSTTSNNVKWIAAAVAAVVLAGVLYFVLKPSGSSDANDVKEIVEQVKDITPTVKTVTNSYFKSALGVCSYTGPVDDEGNPHGKGEASFTDGRLYKGPFEHGTMTGDKAYFRYDNGDTFEGSFKGNSFNRGRYTMKEDGSYFEGTFKNGQPDRGQWYDRQGNKL
jgi:hypothetical protein